MKRLFAIFQTLAVSMGLFAQNTHLNPTVQVTNAYKNSMTDFERIPLTAEIPDSLYKFDLNFDYSGFEKPYKGNDDFNPFLTELDIVGRPFDGRKFYLKAGAGYTLHPQLDMSWLFPAKGRFKAGMFVQHKSYFGKYVYDNDGVDPFKGMDIYTKVGFEGRADWERVWLQAALWYDGVYTKTDWDWNGIGGRRNYNSGSAMFRLASKNMRDENAFRFDLRLKESFGLRGPMFNVPVSGGQFTENVFDFSLLLGYQAGHHFLGLDADANVLGGRFTDDGEKFGGTAVTLRPQYCYQGESITFGLGLSMLVTGTENIMNSVDNGGKEEKFNLWPFLKFEWNAVPDKFVIFADADLKGAPHGERDAWRASHLPVAFKPSVVKTSTADLGFKGTLAKKMQWRIGAGYESVLNANVFGTSAGDAGYLVPVLEVLPEKLEDFNFFLNLDGRFGIFSLDANLCYRTFLHKEDFDVLPSAFTADLRAKFDIRRRASVYAGADFRSSRRAGNGYSTPHYIDLYAGVDFRITAKLGLFIEGRNLLNRRLQTVPLISEKGFVATGGIVLNF